MAVEDFGLPFHVDAIEQTGFGRRPSGSTTTVSLSTKSRKPTESW